MVDPLWLALNGSEVVVKWNAWDMADDRNTASSGSTNLPSSGELDCADTLGILAIGCYPQGGLGERGEGGSLNPC